MISDIKYQNSNLIFDIGVLDLGGADRWAHRFGLLAGWFSKPCLLVLCCIFEDTSLLAFGATRMFGLASKENAFAVVRQREGALLQAITKGEASSSRVTSCEVCLVPNSCLKRLRESPPQAGPSLPVPLLACCNFNWKGLPQVGPPPARFARFRIVQTSLQGRASPSDHPATSSEVCPVPHSGLMHLQGKS